MEQVRRFTEEFFGNLKCEVRWEGEVLVVENVPRSFEDLVGRSAPYNLIFSNCRNQESGIRNQNLDFVGKGSLMLDAMNKFLKGAGKATILKIEFDCDAEAEIRKRLSFRNCEVGSLRKSCRNNFFSRFSFVTSFNYLNESERVVNEIYVHNGEIVSGDLSGYRVIDGEQLEVDSEKVKRDYAVARERVGEILREKAEEVGVGLKEKVDVEVERIRRHYDEQLKELGGDLNGTLDNIKKLELEIRTCEEGEVERLTGRLERLRKGLVKVGDDEARDRILKEREFTVRDAMQKFSLNVDRKLVNTTVIYYSVYSFRLHVKSGIRNQESGVGKFVDMTYDPLTKVLSKLECEGCGNEVVNLSLCSGGHVSCGECLESCGECGRKFCPKCLKRSCGSCGRKLCRDCVCVCMGCGGCSCKTHMRKDCVSGEDRCVLCLRACLRCHGMSEERYFGEAVDGSKVCGKCLGAEKRGEVLERVFRR